MKQFFILMIILFSISSHAQRLEIAEINFQASPCFGHCPVFDMKIMESGEANYNAIQHNKLAGKFTAIMNTSQINDLIKLIEKAEFFNLKDYYSTLASDHPTYVLTIKLKNGQSKTIQDYGPSGPENLKLIYNLILSQTESQSWK